MTIAIDRVHRFTRAEYHQMAAAGVFEGQRVELLEGKVVDVSPQNEPHIFVLSALNRFLHKHLPERYEIRGQAPIGAGEESEPEPDIAVIQKPAEVLAEHPTSAILAVEVSDTTLATDRRKAVIYAKAGVKEYWLVNINARSVEQYTQPQTELGQYGMKKVVKEDEELKCAVLPLPGRLVREFLPRA